MNWQELAIILVPLISLMGWVYSRIEKKAETRFQEIKSEITGLKFEMKDMRKDIQSLESRIARIEGQLIGPPRWEPQVRERKEE